MPSALNRKLSRKSGTTVRDGSKSRELVVTLYPGGTLGLRPAKTRREELIPLSVCYAQAIRMRVAVERAAKKGKR